MTPRDTHGRTWFLVALVAITLGTVVRLAINLRGVVPGGMDAGYYPLQARFILDRGSMYLSDMPLFFWLTAGLAKVLMLAGMTIQDATVMSSRVLDSVLAPWVALPVVMLGAVWIATTRTGGSAASLAHATAKPMISHTDAAGGGGTACAMTPSAWYLLAPALLVTVSSPMMRMVGDYQKQALALVFLAGAIAGVGLVLSRPARAWPGWVIAGVSLMLAGFTHWGTAGAAMIAVACVLGVAFFVSGRISVRVAASAALGGVVICGLVYVGLLLAGAESKAAAFLNAPSKIIGNPVLLQALGGGGRGGPSGPGGGGGPPGMMAIGELALGAGVYAISVLAIGVLWVRRRALDSGLVATGIGAAITAMLLACPLMSGEVFQRVVIIAPVPAAFALGATLIGLTCSTRRRVLAITVGMVSVASMALAGLGRPGLNDEAAAELKQMATLVPEAQRDRTIITARHGLEFWVGHFFGTVARQQPLKPAHVEKYDRVLLVLEKRSTGGGPGGGGPEGRGPGARGGPRRPGGQGGFDGPGGPGGPGGPDGANLARAGREIYSGTYFRVLEIEKDKIVESPVTPPPR